MADADRTRGGCLLFLLAGVLGVPLLAVCGLALSGPPSTETFVFTVGVAAFTVGGLGAPWWELGHWAVRAGLVAALLMVGYRGVTAGEGVAVRGETGPGGRPARFIDRLVPERDVALGGTALLFAIDQAVTGDAPGLQDALRAGYTRMREAEGPVPSAVVGTFALGQRPEAYSQIRVRPEANSGQPHAVLVFLHGYIGNLTLICWQVAQAANPLGVDVVCPSTGWRAEWDAPDGVAIVRSAIDEARAAGAERVYLAGLSAGAVGVSRIARGLEVDGVVLISGASSRPRPKRVPTLVLQGRRDSMTPPIAARMYARRLGRRAEYVEHAEAGHWLVLSHHEWVTRRLGDWLARREGLAGIRRHDELPSEGGSGGAESGQIERGRD